MFVEVLDRRGEVLRRERLTALPFRIGRSCENDLILDDPHVCPAHAVLERSDDGELRLRDLGSRNGVLSLPDRQRLPELQVTSGRTVELGRTPVRFRDASQAVPPALRLRVRPRWLEWSLTHPVAGCLWVATLVGVTLYGTVRTATQKIEWVEVATGIGATLLILAAWSGAWALCGRLLGQRARFVTHLAIGVAGLLASSLQQRIVEIGQFLLEPIEPLRIADASVGGLVTALVVFGHLAVLRVGRASRRALAAVACGAGLLAFQLAEHYGEPNDWVQTLPYWSRLEPIPVDRLSVESSERFFSEVEELGPELDALREKAPEDE